MGGQQSVKHSPTALVHKSNARPYDRQRTDRELFPTSDATDGGTPRWEVMLKGEWTRMVPERMQKVLEEAFEAGNASFKQTLFDVEYEFNLDKMVQINCKSLRLRPIRRVGGAPKVTKTRSAFRRGQRFSLQGNYSGIEEISEDAQELSKKFPKLDPQDVGAALRRCGGDADLATLDLVVLAAAETVPDLRDDPEAWFKHFDQSGNGELERWEVVEAVLNTLGKDFQRSDVEELIDRAWSKFDLDGNSEISMDEFMAEGGLRDAVLHKFQETGGMWLHSQTREDADEDKDECDEVCALEILSKELSSLGEEGVLALYFSARMVGPLNKFRKTLRERYDAYRDAGLEFEVLHISMDVDAASFDAEAKDIPWHVVPFNQQKGRLGIANMYGVQSVPSLMIIGKSGAVYTKQGIKRLTDDEVGSEFPWKEEAPQSTPGGLGAVKLPGMAAMVDAEAAEQAFPNPMKDAQVRKDRAEHGGDSMDDEALARKADRAPITNDGYNEVASWASNYAMKRFARRLVVAKKWIITDEAAFSALIWGHSGVTGKKSLEVLITDLKAVTMSDSPASLPASFAPPTSTFNLGSFAPLSKTIGLGSRGPGSSALAPPGSVVPAGSFVPSTMRMRELAATIRAPKSDDGYKPSAHLVPVYPASSPVVPLEHEGQVALSAPVINISEPDIDAAQGSPSAASPCKGKAEGQPSSVHVGLPGPASGPSLVPLGRPASLAALSSPTTMQVKRSPESGHGEMGGVPPPPPPTTSLPHTGAQSPPLGHPPAVERCEGGTAAVLASGKGPAPPAGGKGLASPGGKGPSPKGEKGGQGPPAPEGEGSPSPGGQGPSPPGGKGPPPPGTMGLLPGGKGPPPPGGKGPPAPGGKGPPAPGGTGPPPPGGKGPTPSGGKATPPPGGKGPPAPGGKGPPSPGGKGPPAPGGKGPPAPGGKGPPAPGGKGPPAPGGKGPGNGPGKAGGKGKKGKGPEPTREEKHSWLGTKTPALRWKRIVVDVPVESVFSDMNGKPIEEAVDESALRQLFMKVEKEIKEQEVKPKLPEKPLVWAEGDKGAAARRQNIAIFTRSVRKQVQALMDHLRHVDLEGCLNNKLFGPEFFEQYWDMVQSFQDEEWSNISNPNAKEIFLWEDAIEGPWLELHQIPGYKQRLQLLTGDIMITADLSALTASIARLSTGLEAIRFCDALARVLRKILFIGNCLNAGQMELNRADGFDVLTLVEKTLLVGMPKGSDNRSLLQFVRDHELSDEEREQFQEMNRALQTWLPPKTPKDEEVDPADLTEFQNESCRISRTLGMLDSIIQDRLAKDSAPQSKVSMAVVDIEEPANEKAQRLLEVKALQEFKEKLKNHKAIIDSVDDALEENKQLLKELLRYFCYAPKKGEEQSAWKILRVMAQFAEQLSADPPKKKRKKETKRMKTPLSDLE